MIGQKLKDNLEKKPNSREMEKFKKDFPQFFSKEGAFKLNIFKDFLSEEEIDISKEGYELKFLGKSYAKYLSSLESETYISPDVEHNSKEENKNSENLYIVGDNIDALKHLLNSYAGKIKCIYIDPPYNTGSDGFIYPDNFQFSVEELSLKIGITEEEAERILDLAGKSTHSAWLTFMYPRLVLARDLLSDDGAIFISIDDNEQANLKLICDEIFGEENFIVDLKWANKEGGGSSDSKLFRVKDEHILVYGKLINNFEIRGLPPSNIERYKESDEYEHTRGKYYLQKLGMGSIQYSESMDYPITMEDGTILYPEDNNSGRKAIWRWSKEKYQWGIENDYIVSKQDKEGNWVLYTKQYLNADNNGNLIERTQIPMGIISQFSSTQGSKELSKLGLDGYFSYPKPTFLIKYLINRITGNEFTCLDFFSGSATTAHAVMELNAEDNGKRKYIMVQLPEKIEENKPAYKAGYRTIDEIGRARIEKAAQKIKEETGANMDYGYKLYYLETPEEKTLIDLENFEPEIKFLTKDMIKIFDNEYSLGKESILTTWLNEDGYGLTKSSSFYTLEHYSADLIEKSLYIIDEGLEDEDVMTLIKRIENGELDITRVVVYVHSLRFNVLHELRKNLKVLRNNKNVSLIERF
ncbi:MAG: site-specific DNA-methyltransferase [Clostridiales bacterium]|nr:site-specific DNA-methyltransferase [Clostridiales bacterium]